MSRETQLHRKDRRQISFLVRLYRPRPICLFRNEDRTAVACGWLLSQTRATPALDLIQDIVMQASARLATAANLGNPTDTCCPFATKTFNAELEWAKT